MFISFLLDCLWFFFFNDTATTEIYTLSLHDALPISPALSLRDIRRDRSHRRLVLTDGEALRAESVQAVAPAGRSHSVLHSARDCRPFEAGPPAGRRCRAAGRRLTPGPSIPPAGGRVHRNRGEGRD